jgi:peptide/nickel transport system substrate-binding protein
MLRAARSGSNENAALKLTRPSFADHEILDQFTIPAYLPDGSGKQTMITRRNVLRGVTVSVASLAASPGLGFAQGAPSVRQPGGSLTVAIFADPLTFDPHLAGNLQGRAACRAIHDTLLTIDQQGRLAPGLAQAWDQPDDKTIVLRLRPGVTFHDGTTFDAAAVKYNIERIRSGKLGVGAIRAGEIRTLDTVEAPNAATVVLRLKSPFSAFLYPFTDMAGCIGSPTAFERWGLDYALHPAGTGPFKLAEYLKDAHTVFERNGAYWMAGKPLLDRLVLRPIPTDSTRLAELRAGGAQIAEALPLQDVQRLRRAGEFVISEKVGFRWEYFGLNLHDKYPGRNKAFRQAFQWAIDREALHHVAYFGTGSVGYDGILPSSPFHDPNYRPFHLDLDRAKRLIEQSDLPTPIVLQAPLQPDPVKQRAAQVLQANIAPLGIKLDIQQVDTAGYGATLQSGTLPIDLQGWWGYRPDPDQYLAILLASWGSYAKYNAYDNPKMDELIRGEQGAKSEADRRQYLRQVSELMNEDAVYVPWHYSSDFKGLNGNVKGFIHPPDGIIDFRELSVAL